jgi:Fe-S cluster assembly protein SufD
MARDGRERFVSAFARFEPEAKARGPGWLHELRGRAIVRFAERGLPTTRDERWRHTSLAPFERTPFDPAASPRNGVDKDRIRQLCEGIDAAARLVFVNGVFAPDLSSTQAFATSLAAALEARPGEVEPLLAREASEGPFVALNTAFFRDGAFVRIPEKAEIGAPIHLLFVTAASGGEPPTAHPRNLVLAGRGSRAALLEHYVDLGQGPSFTNAVTDVVAEEGASIERVKLLEEGEEAFHFARLRARAGRDARLGSHALLLGGGLVRDEVEALLDAEGIDCTVNGLYVVGGRRHVDNQTRIDHARPRCTSRELYKGILDGEGRGVFEGTILVRPDAQRTNAHQSNRNLLLSENALATTRPILEIRADDVRCKHGATIGQLEEAPLFYLRARGVGAEEARALLVYAFAEEVLAPLPVPAVRDRVERFLRRRLGSPAALLEAR